MREASVQKLINRIGDSPDYAGFCPAAFGHLYNDNAGRWRLCCHAQPFEHTVATTTPAEHLNHPLMRQLRREFSTGKPELASRYCRKCLKLEKLGMDSPRTMKVRKLLQSGNPAQHSQLRAAARTLRRRDGRLDLKERSLELKLRVFGNTCNLRCYMCAPVNSSSRIRELEKIRDGYWLRRMTVPDRHGFFEEEAGYERFITDTVSLLPAVKKIRITGGEPFLLRKHHDFLERVIAAKQAQNIMLTYDSNMMAFGHGRNEVADYLRHFKQVTIFVSIDNLGPKNDYIRRGSHFEQVLANIEKARSMPNIKIAVNCSTGILSAGDVVSVAEFFERLDLETAFAMCVVTKPLFLQARHLPDALKSEYIGRISGSPFAGRMRNIIQMMELDRNEEQFATCIRYLRDLDRKRGTDFLKLWPELEPYAKAVSEAAGDSADEGYRSGCGGSPSH